MTASTRSNKGKALYVNTSEKNQMEISDTLPAEYEERMLSASIDCDNGGGNGPYILLSKPLTFSSQAMRVTPLVNSSP